jgi:hypothetical protein
LEVTPEPHARGTSGRTPDREQPGPGRSVELLVRHLAMTPGPHAHGERRAARVANEYKLSSEVFDPRAGSVLDILDKMSGPGIRFDGDKTY